VNKNINGFVNIGLVIVFATLVLVGLMFVRLADTNTAKDGPIGQVAEGNWQNINNEQIVVADEPMEIIDPNDVVEDTSIKFVSVFARQNGNTVQIQSTINSNQTGICFYKFQNGSTIIKRQNTISNSNGCHKNVNTEYFLVSGDWTLTLEFRARNQELTLKFVPVLFTVTF
jgi:hypothetical protein